MLVDYELDPEVVDELASGRTGGWTGGRRHFRRSGLGWRTLVRPIWPLVLLLGVLAAGVRAVSVIPAAMWVPLVLDLLRLAAVATPIAFALALLARRLRRR